MTQTLEEKGNISVNMENIFPIIKKWLYSDKEIFLRELVSNAVDAINKLKHLRLIGEAKESDEEYKIKIRIDKISNTLTISDNGIGLTADEAKKYINQVAFSGAEEFIKKYKSGKESDQIIGHFGLGFYSSFMISKKVEIQSLSYQEGAEPIKWECEGTPEFKITKGNREKIGTDIILYLQDDEKEFLEEERIKNLIKKYCDFLPYQIEVNGVVANRQKALWNEQPSSLKKEDYLDFYRYLYPFAPEPLFWIHVNVDYPFHLKGILYFPKLTHELDFTKGHVKLFCNNVYVSENTQELLPKFLAVLQGGIDSPDIPLNVSRSMLQNEPSVRKISSHISKKVADRLKEIFNKDRKEYEKIWDGINPFIKVGVMEDGKFYDYMKDYFVFKSATDDNYFTIKEYKERNESKTGNKIYYTSDKDIHSSYIQLFKSQDIDVVLMDSFVDSHFINFLELREHGTKFSRIDSDDVHDILVDKDKKDNLIVDPKGNRTESDILEEIFKNALDNKDFKIKVQSLKSSEIPSMVIFDEQARRIHEMSSIIQQKDLGLMKDFTLVLNSNNPIINNLKKIANDASKKEEVNLLCNHLYDLALLNQKQLPQERMQKFFDRSFKIMELLSSK